MGRIGVRIREIRSGDNDRRVHEDSHDPEPEPQDRRQIPLPKLGARGRDQNHRKVRGLHGAAQPVSQPVL